jgi:hypothetical protein
MSQLIESSSSTVTLPKPDAPPAPPSRHSPPRRPRPPRRQHEQGAAIGTGEGARSTAELSEAEDLLDDGAPGRSLRRADEAGLSNQERRRRLEALALRLFDTPEFNSRLHLYERHTLGELSSAAALRPDLMPTLNGEFEHLAFFTP